MRVAALLVGLLLAFAAGSAHAQREEILSFDSRIEVGSDGILTVTESITVRAMGHNIKRGIYRDFPTIYRKPGGTAHRVSFDVVSVLRDGRPEPWSTKSKGNGIRIYIGDKDHLLAPGRYSYRLTYRTDRQIGFFERHDELYWNVTGNGWVFPIANASAAVILPGGAEPVETAGYTGPQGARGTNWAVGRDGLGELRFRATRRLAAEEGLTIVVAWPKGYVVPPTAAQLWRWWLRDNYPWLIMAFALLIVSGYFAAQWLLVGRDRRTGNTIPRFEPPAGMSAAASRYIFRMGFDKRVFGVVVISLATKGQLRISRQGTMTLLQRPPDPPVADLSPEEDNFCRHLFADRNRETVSRKNRNLSLAARTVKRRLESDCEDVYFKRNFGAYVIGATTSVFAAFAIVLAADQAVLDGAMWIGFGLLAALIGINVLFFRLLKAPTARGRQVLDEIDGFRMYLATAENERLKLFNPPERTPEIFERYLPYALALDLENEWVAQFSAVLAGAAVAGAGVYQPEWLDRSDADWSWDTTGAAIGGIGDALGGNIASAATPPGLLSGLPTSGSGSYSGGGYSGGGFSGGGGGGGGGGGW